MLIIVGIRNKNEKSGKKGLSDGRHPHSGEEEIDDLKRMIGEQTLVINAFKKRLQGGSR